jgi:hypothetical protein
MTSIPSGFLNEIASGHKEVEKAVALLWLHDHHDEGTERCTTELADEIEANRLVAGKVNRSRLKTNLKKSKYTVLGKQKDRFRIGIKHKSELDEKYRHLLVSDGKKKKTINDADALRQMASGVGDSDVEDYIKESIRCLEADAQRAAVLFLWIGAVRRIQTDLWRQGNKKDINASVQMHEAGKTIKKADDFCNIKEDSLLKVALDVGLFDKNQKDTLEKSCLDLRNKCGHPGKYRPGPHKVRAFIEDVSTIVFGAKHS